ncbi:MAG: ATP-binding protein [Lachnospiraceae bacterium]|nr:ATP-binding protein [Lachnospiraceae bacterium]
MINLVYTCLDVFAIYLFTHNLFRSKADKLHFILLGFLAALGVCGVNLFNNTWLNFFFVPLILTIFVRLTFQISTYRAVVFTFIHHIILACGRELAFMLLAELLMSVCPEFGAKYFVPGEIPFMTIEYIYSICVLVILGRYTRKVELPENSRGDWYLLIMPIASIVILFCFAYLDFPDNRVLQVLMCGGAFLLDFANLVVFVILAHFTVALNQVKLAELSLLKQDLDKANFDNMEKLNMAYRRYMHDIHHYFYQIRNLAMEGEDHAIMDMIDQVEGQIKTETDKRIYVGNRMLNSILAVSSQKAEGYGVELSILAEENIDMSFVKDIDMISMFGNILDNAIEAAAKCEPGKRRADARLFMGSRYILYFEVRNTWNGVLEKEDQKLLSMKRDAGNHGLGIDIVKELAHKYGGDFEMTGEDEWFVTILYLSSDKR